MAAVAPFRLENSYARDLQGFSVPWRPEAAPAPRSLFFNAPLADELGLDVAALAGAAGADVFAGNEVPEGAEPIAQVYAGHQFGGFSPQLGDGRAILLGEVIDRAGRRRDIALKGSGRTPFSRGGDGKAAVGPMLREVLIGEAMHALGIPTTRALAVVATGQPVLRETVLPGAVLTRVAASHIRVGTFQFFAARGDAERVRQLAEYTIARHDADLVGAPGRFLALLERVAERQAMLIAQWMNVGFIHGVMNTDNMTISGETIDYGPCAFVEAYDPAAVFSSIDSQGRYAFGNQPSIARWNLARLAECLLPLLADDEAQAMAEAMRVIDAFPAAYRRHLLNGQRAKLGLERVDGADDGDDARLADDWLALLHAGHVDFTLAWRRLADAAGGETRRCGHCSVVGRGGRSPMRGSSAGASAAPARKARRPAARRTKGARRACAASTPGSSRATIASRKRSPRRATAMTSARSSACSTRCVARSRRSAENASYAEPAAADITAGYRTFCGT